MNQIVQDKMAREIMVVKNEYLFANTPRETQFYSQSEANFEKIILDQYEYMVRREAETNFEYKQPIPYAVLVDEQDRVFVYKRGGAGSNAGEARLHSKISYGIGGHIEREDEHLDHPINDSLVREIEEETGIGEKNIVSIEAIGYINDEQNEVAQVHIGVAYIVRVHDVSVELLDGELENGEFYSLDEIEQMNNSCEYDLETWSEILFQPMHDILKKAGV
ncbi:NUDIX domain-containing protein [Candidatus Gracilibacteria bacterium]|nr:NUDIX domain-containing protein [Candidatus Gracilibacteria bacterium]